MTTKPEPKFPVGTIVRKRGGGPPMKIVQADDGYGWVVTAHVVERVEAFDPETLELAPEEN